MDDYSKEAIKARNALAKGARWDNEKQAYICQYCDGVVTTARMAHGYDCNACGLPINER